MSEQRSVAKVLHHLVEPPRPCSYLTDRDAQLEIRVMDGVTVDELEALPLAWLASLRPGLLPARVRGLRRVRHAPRRCFPPFEPSKSQRRAVKNAARLRRVVGVPIVDDERLALYHRWHAQREQARGWEPSELDAERYAVDFAFPHPAVREVAFRDPADGDRLVGLGVFDEMPRSLSAIYFFWDPERAPPSLGVANVVTLIGDREGQGAAAPLPGYR